MEKHTVVAVDIAKVVFDVAVSHEPGRVAETCRLSRKVFLLFFAQMPAATVVMEACGSAHFWARKLHELGHRVVLLPPHQVRPYVVRNKTDRTDAKGILEAYRNADIRPVPVKSVSQQVLVILHRFRSGWLGARTAHINTLRGLLRELGLVIPVGAEKVLPQVRALIGDADSGIPEALRPVLAAACEEIQTLSERIKMTERQIEAIAEQTPVVERLWSIPGIGLLIATALVAFVGDIHRFPSGRHFASYLGLTPREYSSGLRRRLGRIFQAGGRLPPHALDPRRAIRALPRKEDQGARSAPELGPRPRATGRTQQGGGCPREQAGPPRLGGLEERPRLRVPPQGRVVKKAQKEGKDSPTPALHSESSDGETGRTGEREAENKFGPQRPLSSIGSRSRVFHHGPGHQPQPRGRRYVCSPDLHAIASSHVRPVPRPMSSRDALTTPASTEGPMS